MNQSSSSVHTAPMEGVFSLRDQPAYERWRALKLQRFPKGIDDCRVVLQSSGTPSPTERTTLLEICARCNFALYRFPGGADHRRNLKALTASLGLRQLDPNLCADDDALTTLKVVTDGRHKDYIPYSNRALNWHTDGYYNRMGEDVQAWALHCVQPALEGGENALLDPEIAYILLRDQDPAFIQALSHPNAFTIPPNDTGGQRIRGARSAAVFSISPEDGALRMRYSARKRNIIWREDPITREAVAFLDALLSEPSPYIFHVHLASGEGVISNNALHNRSGFRDSQNPSERRQVLRGRYYERVDIPAPASL